MSAYQDLLAFQRETEALQQVSGRLGWDQETVMPRGAAAQRGEEMAAMEGVLHARRTDPRVGDWLAAIDDAALDTVAAAQMRHIRRAHDRATRVPARLSAELARVTSLAQGAWAEARAADDFQRFAPILAEVIRLRQEEGAALAEGTDYTPYDAMIQDYEPGASAAFLENLFGALRPRLVSLREKLLGAPTPKGLSGTFDMAQQLALSETVAKAFGYDLARGRIDRAVHPFSSGSGQDVRITTRTDAQNPFDCLYSTIHEVGHACYEQNIHSDFLLTPLGAGVSMGVHESQSRIYENQIGRSRAFCEYLYGQMRDRFGDLGVDNAEAFYAAVNTVHRDYIRTEADEVQYNLHVLIRFDLERQLISGDLPVADLEQAWNTRFETDFGYPVNKPSNGCLQDVHWSVGLFGYFPTYTLGNVYAGSLHEALRRDVPQLDEQLMRGDTSGATGWLRENVQQHGGLYEPRELITLACGKAPSEAPLLDYLEAKFGAIYGV
ncbi:carboxypeptidase M32 [Primorskyibacter marinus]|uniref:carboxypeptidase M32 n=1 Tax=Primorskyibacter marinus TaxID=1977320 RepID=UPI000E30378D|nr:carboxypeptidase M32 [Primorskyibacter marinus]